MNNIQENTSVTATADYTWTSDNLLHYPLIEHVALDPTGQRVLYTVRRPHFGDTGSEFRHTTYLAHLPSANGQSAPSPRALTREATAAQPRWSPDGKWIAFLRPMPGTDKMGLWIMPTEGGEPWPLTGVANGIRHAVTSFEWSPDGQSIALLTVPWDEEFEARRRTKNDTRQWRVDYNFTHLYLVGINTIESKITVGTLPPARALTQGRLHVIAFDWAPDSSQIAFMHRPTPYIDSWPQARLATVSAQPTSGDMPALTDCGLVASWESNLAYSPDGKWIACEVGHDDHQWPYACRIHLFPVGGGTPRPLHDVIDDQPTVLGWSPDSQQVYVQAENGLSSAIFALPIDGGAPQSLYSPDRLITAVHVSDQGDAVFVQENLTEPQAIYTISLTASRSAPTPLRLLAQPQATAYPSGPLPQVRVLNWQTPDGFDIEGVLYLPASYDLASDETLPLLLHIHGGPMSVFQRQFAATPYYYTPAALCERGIAVLRCNPRGSGGYGKRFRYANMEDWGGGDFRDLMQGVDLVMEQGIADPQQLGICGWSYGGYMSSWAITQTNRFVAASIGAPVTNLISFVGTADIPSFIPGFFGGEVWESTELMIERSPLFQAHKGSTPSIIQHGDADERVPLEQGLQYYMALERRGVPVEMYIYPRQGHAINEPHLLADAIERNLAWFTAKLVTPGVQ
jgi:dipeptidyl aminopeptidase/acylaminoacyl peptidase